jgi:hypothetical protein
MAAEVDPLLEAVKEARKKDYGRGLADGMRVAFQLMLGQRPDSGGSPYPGRLNQSAEEWAERQLAAVERMILEDAERDGG